MAFRRFCSAFFATAFFLRARPSSRSMTVRLLQTAAAPGRSPEPAPLLPKAGGAEAAAWGPRAHRARMPEARGARRRRAEPAAQRNHALPSRRVASSKTAWPALWTLVKAVCVAIARSRFKIAPPPQAAPRSRRASGRVAAWTSPAIAAISTRWLAPTGRPMDLANPRSSTHRAGVCLLCSARARGRLPTQPWPFRGACKPGIRALRPVRRDEAFSGGERVVRPAPPIAKPCQIFT